MDVNAKTKPGQETPLHFAARAGNVEAMGILLDNGAKVDAASIINETPLHSAAWKGNLEAVKLLVSKGANVYEQFHNVKFEGWKTAFDVVPEGEQHDELRNFLKAQQTTKAYLWDCIKNPTSHKFVSAGVLATAGTCLYGAWKCLSPESQKYIAGIVSAVCIATYVIKQVKDYFYPSNVASI